MIRLSIPPLSLQHKVKAGWAPRSPPSLPGRRRRWPSCGRRSVGPESKAGAGGQSGGCINTNTQAHKLTHTLAVVLFRFIKPQTWWAVRLHRDFSDPPALTQDCMWFSSNVMKTTFILLFWFVLQLSSWASSLHSLHWFLPQSHTQQSDKWSVLNSHLLPALGLLSYPAFIQPELAEIMKAWSPTPQQRSWSVWKNTKDSAKSDIHVFIGLFLFPVILNKKEIFPVSCVSPCVWNSMNMWTTFPSAVPEQENTSKHTIQIYKTWNRRMAGESASRAQL